MLYELCLKKNEKWLWGEDTFGKCIFNAADDRQALAFATTIVYSMNKRYNRISELRGVYIAYIHHLEAQDFGFNQRSVDLNNKEPLKGFRLIRKALNYFYSKRDGRKGRSSLMPCFCDYRPTPNNLFFL